MKKKYVQPEVLVMRFELEDVIATSDGLGVEGTNPPGDIPFVPQN